MLPEIRDEGKGSSAERSGGRPHKTADRVDVIYLLFRLVGYAARTVLFVLGEIITLINTVVSFVVAVLPLRLHQPVILGTGLFMAVYGNSNNKCVVPIKDGITRPGHLDVVGLFLVEGTIHGIPTQCVIELLFFHASASF